MPKLLKKAQIINKKPHGNATHGMSKHPMMRIHERMMAVCYKEHHPQYKNYGAKGVTVCRRWRSNKMLFINWVKDNGWDNKKVFSLKPGSAEFSPKTCEFIDRKVINKRGNLNRKDSKISVVNDDGEPALFSELWKEKGVVGYTTAYNRYMLHGWPLEAALTTPVGEGYFKVTTRKQLTKIITEAAIDWAVVKQKLGVYAEVGIINKGSLRIDLLGISFKNELVGFEVKSGYDDLKNDKKWHRYADYFNRLYLCVYEKFYKEHTNFVNNKIKEVGAGLLILSSETGYCHVKKKATRLPGPSDEYKMKLLTKLVWLGADGNKNTIKKRTKYKFYYAM